MLCGFVAYVLSIASLDCLVRGLQLDQSAVEKPYPQIPCDAAEGTDCAPSTIPSNPLSLFQKPWNPRGWRKIETRIGLGFGPNLIHWQDSVLHRFGTMSCKDLALKSLPTEAAAAVGQCAWHLQKRQQPLHSGFVTNVPTFYVALDGDVARNWLANFSAFTSNLRIVDGILGTNRNDVERMASPPMFTSFNRRSDVQSEEKKWVTQSFCDDISSALRHGSLACASNKSPL
eukprot:TRINITY_DN12355_c0_g1_i1.p1 TRINITY_DN12355_c0_g1~~TRINITY_DN12355_c0_g1_i1.p1  ORF type:complete len:241 (+),score=33.63 TRINITY_DN12355_c0_g1_i1:34-723(+)